MIGGGEALIMHTSGAAGSDDHGFRTGKEQILGLHIQKNRAGCSSLLIKDKLNGGCEIRYFNAPVQHLVPEGTP